MPNYLFEDIKTGKVEEIFLHMSEVQPFTKENNKKLRRVYTKPNASIDTRCDPHSAKDFAKVTAKPGTYGQLMDLSKEMSEKRADKNGGVDPVKEQYYAEHKKRTGKEHPTKKQEAARKKLSKFGINIKNT